MSKEKTPHLTSLLSQVDELCRADLTALNRYIVERSKQMDDASRAEVMAQFKPGDAVSFRDKHGEKHQAMVLRLNKKTVSLSTYGTDHDERWNVSPEILTLEYQRETFSEDTPALPTHTQTQSIAKSQLQTTTSEIGQVREWIGGTITMPAFITGEPGDNYQPTIPVWLNEIGQVVGMDIISPDDPPFDFIASLKATIANPKAGVPGAPSHLRVNDKKLADTLKNAFPSINVSCSATPELDQLAKQMGDDMPEQGEPQTYSQISTDNHVVESFFKSTAALYKLQPWNIVPHDQCLIGVTIDTLNINDGVISVIGQKNESFGVILFDTLIEHEQYTIVADAIELDQPPNIPPHRSLSFDNANDIHTDVRKDIARHKWVVASADAYPTLMFPTPDQLLKPLNEGDIELFDVIAQALCSALSQTEFVQALLGGDEQTAQFEILTKNSPTLITLQAPYPYERVTKAAGAPDDLIAQLLLLERASDYEPDWDKHDALTNQLLAHYEASPESQAANVEFGAASLLVSFAFDYWGCTIATISPVALRDIIFSIIPRKVMIQPSDAADVINDCRAFLHFLHRVYAMERALDCISILDDNAVDRLAQALDNPNNFGMAKSLFSTHDHFSPFELPAPIPGPSATKPKPVSKKSRKKKRAAARKARKKNR